MRRISKPNAAFQQWHALLGNRGKRNRAGTFLVQGVRPISVAVAQGWPIHTLLHATGAPLSEWAGSVMSSVDCERVAVADDLLAELGEKDEPPELVAVAGIPPDDPDRLPIGEAGVVVVFDRPTSPGNLGTVLRSADAFGATGLIVTGHAADVYEPKCVRSSTGSVFAVPAVRLPSHREVLDWVAGLTVRPRIVGTAESGSSSIDQTTLSGPMLLVVGNETRGMSAAWHDTCDDVVRIPIGGSSSSLNAATAASIALYEIARQRSR